MASFVTEWANDGFAVEVDRNKVITMVMVVVVVVVVVTTTESTTAGRPVGWPASPLAHYQRPPASLTRRPRPTHVRDQAAIAALPLLKAAFAPESSTTFYRAKLIIWPLPAPLPPADTLLATTDSAAAEAPAAGAGVPVYSRPSFTISLRYKSSKYARQGEAVFRNTILAFVREMPGFVECW